MKKTIKITLACGMLLALGACSSGQTEGGDGGDQPAPAADAGTDAVPPAAGTENADAANPPPADGSTPPPADGSAPPPPDASLAGTPPPADGSTPPPPADAGAPPPPAADSMAHNDSTPPSPAGSGSFDDYKVQVGDTLMKIAFETYGDLYRWKSIYEANKDKIHDPNHVPANMVLKLEKPVSSPSVEKNGEKYMIKAGDTLGTISQDVYGTRKKWKTLWENNKALIHDPNKIFAGFYLYYQPDGNSPKNNDSTTSPAPMADAAPAAPPPGTPTATTTGDMARAPASAVPPPPPGDVPPPPPTATQ